jgi:hypothetical protein
MAYAKERCPRFRKVQTPPRHLSRDLERARSKVIWVLGGEGVTAAASRSIFTFLVASKVGRR